MEVLAWPSIGWYCLFSIFTYYQQLHVKNFRGSSQRFAVVLTVSAFFGMLTGLAYLIYYGWTVAWWAPFVIFLVSLPTMMLGGLMERMLGALAVSLGGFIGWPVCAYLMFKQIPVQA